MPSDRDETRAIEKATKLARQGVLVLSVVFTFTMTIAALAMKEPLPVALTAGLGTGLSGLAAWWTSHLITRRTDGIGFFFIPCGCFFLPPKGTTSFVMIGVALIYGVFLGALAGAWTRWGLRRRARGKRWTPTRVNGRDDRLGPGT